MQLVKARPVAASMAECPVPSAECQVPSAKCPVLSATCRVWRVPGAESQEFGVLWRHPLCIEPTAIRTGWRGSIRRYGTCVVYLGIEWRLWLCATGSSNMHCGHSFLNLRRAPAQSGIP